MRSADANIRDQREKKGVRRKKRKRQSQEQQHRKNV